MSLESQHRGQPDPPPATGWHVLAEDGERTVAPAGFIKEARDHERVQAAQRGESWELGTGATNLGWAVTPVLPAQVAGGVVRPEVAVAVNAEQQESLVGSPRGQACGLTLGYECSRPEAAHGRGETAQR